MTSKKILPYISQSSHGIYYFRIRIPKNIRILYDSRKKEIKKSLRTRDLSVAVKKARHLWVIMEDTDYSLGKSIKKMERDFREDNEAKKLLYEYLVIEMEDPKSYFKDDDTDSPLELFLGGLSEHGVSVLNEELDKWYKLPLPIRNREIKRIAESHNIDDISGYVLDEKNPIASKFDYITKLSDDVLVSKALESYLEYYTDRKSRSRMTVPSSTVKEFDGIYKGFLSIIGEEIKCSDLNKEVVKKYQNSIWKLPANYTRKRKYKDKSTDEILNMEIPIKDKRSVGTYNKHALRVKQFLTWAGKEGYISSDLESFIEYYADSVKDNEKRDAFTADELSLLFNNDVYEKSDFKKPSQYWLPLLALFTGARGRELAQLYADDIEKDQDSGIYSIRIRSSDERQQHLKNRSATRIIPIHSKLVALGFLDFVAKKKSKSMLFTELESTSGNSFKIFGNNFNRKNEFGWKWKYGVQRDKTSFHSFRHNAIDCLVKSSVDERLICSLVGHQHKGGGVVGNYVKSDSIKNLKRAIDKLEYLSIQWRKIKKLDWRSRFY